MPLDTKKLGEQITEKTTAPVIATPAHVAGQDPEFLDALGVQARFSIRRSLLYELHNGGHIESVSLRRRGQSRGKRPSVAHRRRPSCAGNDLDKSSIEQCFEFRQHSQLLKSGVHLFCQESGDCQCLFFFEGSKPGHGCPDSPSVAPAPVRTFPPLVNFNLPSASAL